MLKSAFPYEVWITFNWNDRSPFYSKQQKAYLIFTHSAITTDISKSTTPWLFEWHMYILNSQQRWQPRTDSTLPSLTGTRGFNRKHRTNGTLLEETFCKTAWLCDTPYYLILQPARIPGLVSPNLRHLTFRYPSKKYYYQTMSIIIQSKTKTLPCS